MAHDEHGQGDKPRGERGPAGSEFLDLELSRVLYGEAEALSRDAARELIREAIRDRLRARLGDKLRAIGELAADALADDIETNLGIEDSIARRKAARAQLEVRLREIVHQPGAKPSGRRR